MSDDEVIYRPGQVIAGRYRVSSPLSQGGMGAVYLAQQVSLGRDVALKVILERGSDPELIGRFDVEARAVCQLKHPNIITYHDYGRDDEGHPFLVMEFLAGYSGVKLVYGERRPALQDLVHVVTQVCSALQEAHHKGIIHRDLKWSNVMICPQSHDAYFAKLIDFGIMKVATDGSSGDQRARTRTGMLLGTPEYMSPEAICGMPIDGRADQYSLAIMMWEAVEGHRPFEGASHFELLRQQVQDPPPPFEVASELLQRYPALEAAILKGMEKHPDDRFPDILAFQKALMAAIGKAPKTASRQPGTQLPARDTAPKPRSERAHASGMPSSRQNLPAARSTPPRPVDTRAKTGLRDADDVPRRPHWAWLALGFLVFVGIGFGIVMAILPKKDEDAGGRVASLTDVADEGRPAPDTKTAPDTATAPETIADSAAPPDSALAATTSSPDAAATPEVVATTAVLDAVATVVVPDAVAIASLPDVAATAPEVVAPKAVAPGHLFIQVDPWANLAIDGRPVGRAPYDAEIKAGSHTVTVTNTFFKGAFTFSVKVQPGKRTSRLVVLENELERIE